MVIRETKINAKKTEQEINTIDSQITSQELKVLKSGTELENIKIVQPVVKPAPRSQKQAELKSLFILSSSGSSTPKLKLNDCLVLYENLIEKNKISNINAEIFEFDRENLILSIFCNRISSLNLLRQEETELKRMGFERWWIFEIWKGNLFKVVKELKDSKQLNDLIMSLYQSTISVLNKSCLELVNSYIEQLSLNGNNSDCVIRAILHCCCTYQIQKAVDICLEYNMYQYALCIAQIRLAADSEILSKILIKYAVYSTQVGDYEMAVLCYIRLGDLENAYKTLIRRNSKNDSEFEHCLKLLSEKFKVYLNVE
ncbi:gem-associated 5 [Brachionus plicatilis]|uniref:Gem-associated 5 n=1 Tax=Brachionus plicatilis TaxID=10195 RepID=A0A3M7QHJ3_BRAPC|nr:gem-associated 5 [Brachionus plicatilis]